MAVAGAALFVLLYASGVRRLAARGRAWPAARTVAMVAAAASVVVATAPFVGGAGDERFTAHAMEHVLLGMVAPVLAALSAPVTLALQAGGDGTRRRLRRALHSRAATLAGHPLVGWTLFGTTLFALYLSPVLRWSLEHRAVHEAVHLHLVTAGCLFAWPLVGVDVLPRRLPHGARLLAVLVAVPFHAFLGLVVAHADTPLGGGPWSVEDQRTGAALMWAAGELLAGALAVAIVAQWGASDDRDAARADRRLAGLPETVQARSARQSSDVAPGT